MCCNVKDSGDNAHRQGKVIIFSAPSGSGKSTIIKRLMEHDELHLSFSVSCTSRAPREGEKDGREYFFISAEEFRQRIASGEFLEYEEVYAGTFYGTLRSEVERQLSCGTNVVLDIDVKGARNVKEAFGCRAISLFVQPPSISELRRRLEQRGTESAASIEYRIARAEYELGFAAQSDRVIVNDDLALACREAYEAIKAFIA